jgi:hypothetical protein
VLSMLVVGESSQDPQEQATLEDFAERLGTAIIRSGHNLLLTLCRDNFDRAAAKGANEALKGQLAAVASERILSYISPTDKRNKKTKEAPKYEYETFRESEIDW